MAAEGPEPTGVVFPEVDGRRSTGATGRAIVADALRPVDPVGAAAAARETSWRSGYLTHFRRLVEAGLARPEDAVAIADAGLASLYDRMCWRDPDGRQVRLEAALGGVAGSPADLLTTEELPGGGEVETALTVPYRGQRLGGDDLRRQLDTWVADGVVEPSLREAVGDVIDHPEWLRLEGRIVVVLGAAAEMGPLRSLLRWGGTVAAVDLPRPDLWTRPAHRHPRPRRAGAHPGRPGVVRPRPTRRGRPHPRPADGHRLGLRPAGVARRGQLRLRRRGHQRSGQHRRRRPHRDGAPGPPRHGDVVPRHPHRRVRRARRGRRRVGAGLRRPPHVQGAARPAAHALGWAPAAAQLRARRGPRHQRLRRAPAGPQLPPGQAAPALAGHLRPGPGCDRVVQDRPADPHPLGRQEPRRWRRRTPGRTASGSRSSTPERPTR